MSLINQMLQDLEKRGENQDSHAAAHYAQFGDVVDQTKSRKVPWFFFLLFVFGAIAIAVFFFVSKTKQSVQLVTANVSSSEKLPTVSKEALLSANSIKPADATIPDASPALSELGLSLKLSTQVNAAGLTELTERAEPNARVKGEQDIPVQTEINSKQNKLMTSSAIQDTPKSHKLAESESIPASSINNGGIVKKTVVTSVSAAPVSSAPVTMLKEVSIQQRAEGEYRQATVYQQQGRVNEALSALDNALKADPLHAPARQLLISLLLENKRYEEAIRELRQGLVVEPTQLNFSMILARLLVERAKLPDAIDVLQKNINLAQDRPDYLAFLAALQQKSGHHKDAISLYRQALRSHSQNGAWWMGLGISLQAEANSQEAIEAYKQAKQQPGLSAELHAFIDQKISQLQK